MKIDTIPKLYKSAKGWYINYWKDGQQVRNSFGFNKIANLEQREAMYNAMIKNIISQSCTGALLEQANMTFSESLDFAMLKKTPVLSEKTILDYNCSVRFIKTAVKKAGLDKLKIADTRRVHIKTILEKGQTLDNWSNHTYNKRLDHVKAILSELIQFDIIENNPAYQIRKLTVEESNKHNPPTTEEAEKIRAHLEPAYPRFWAFVLMEYHLAIRPFEIFNIQLSMIDMEKGIITLTPKNVKNRKKYRYLQINKHLRPHLERLNFEGLPKDYYLFGTDPPKTGVHFKDRHKEYFPSPLKMKRGAATWFWQQTIIIGLEIDVSLYAIKKLGANRKREAGISFEAIGMQMGHSDVKTTKIYTTQEEVIYNKELMDKSPDFY